jgi:hypothetical protein
VPPSSRFGDALSGAELRINDADRATVMAKLGEPNWRSPDDLRIAYFRRIYKGSWYGLIPGPCGVFPGGLGNTEFDDVWLEFDQAGVLRRAAREPFDDLDADASRAWTAWMSNPA